MEFLIAFLDFAVSPTSFTILGGLERPEPVRFVALFSRANIAKECDLGDDPVSH
jgi:hypothetical protein